MSHIPCPRCTRWERRQWKVDCPCCGGTGWTESRYATAQGVIFVLGGDRMWSEYDRRGEPLAPFVLSNNPEHPVIDEDISETSLVWVETHYGPHGMTANWVATEKYPETFDQMALNGRLGRLFDDLYRKYHHG